MAITADTLSPVMAISSFLASPTTAIANDNRGPNAMDITGATLSTNLTPAIVVAHDAIIQTAWGHLTAASGDVRSLCPSSFA